MSPEPSPDIPPQITRLLAEVRYTAEFNVRVGVALKVESLMGEVTARLMGLPRSVPLTRAEFDEMMALVERVEAYLWQLLPGRTPPPLASWLDQIEVGHAPADDRAINRSATRQQGLRAVE